MGYVIAAVFIVFLVLMVIAKVTESYYESHVFNKSDDGMTFDDQEEPKETKGEKTLW